MKHLCILFVILLYNCSPVSGQDVFSFRKIKSAGDKILIVGKYTSLIEKQGVPNTTIESSVGITEYIYYKDTDSIIDRIHKKIDVTYLVYGDSIQYIMIKDSVQLAYVDFSVSGLSICYNGLSLNKYLKFHKAAKAFSLKKNTACYKSTEYRDNKVIPIKTFGVRTKNKEPYDDNMWLVFNANSNRLWYLDFPLQCEGGIIK